MFNKDLKEKVDKLEKELNIYKEMFDSLQATVKELWNESHQQFMGGKK